MKVAASSSELGPTRAPRIKAGRLDDDDNHDDEERGTQNGKDTRFPRLCFPRKKPTTFFRPSPLLSSERIRSKNSFVRFHFCPRENEREKRGKEGKRRDATVFWSLDLENGGNRGGAATKTHLPASRNEFVGCHSTGRTRLNPISSAAHLSL